MRWDLLLTFSRKQAECSSRQKKALGFTFAVSEWMKNTFLLFARYDVMIFWIIITIIIIIGFILPFYTKCMMYADDTVHWFHFTDFSLFLITQFRGFLLSEAAKVLLITNVAHPLVFLSLEDRSLDCTASFRGALGRIQLIPESSTPCFI